MKLRLIATLAAAAIVGTGACNTTKTDSRGAEASGAAGTASPGASAPESAPAGAPASGPSVGSLTSVSAADGDLAPDFAWSDASGEHKLSDYRGRVVLINFWGTWCPPCRRELPSLVKIREELGRVKFEIIGVNVGEQPRGELTVEQHVASFASTNSIRYPLVIADENLANAYGGIEVVPTTFIVDGNGKIVERIQGSRDEAGFRDLIQKAM
jgi:thiol-disulfide isomerase/thioredoxin